MTTNSDSSAAPHPDVLPIPQGDREKWIQAFENGEPVEHNGNRWLITNLTDGGRCAWVELWNGD